MMAHGECDDSLPPSSALYHDHREQHINIAGIKAMMLASKTYGRLEPPVDICELEPMRDPFFGRWCDAQTPLGTSACHAEKSLICAFPHTVRQRTQCGCGPEGCADGQCPGRNHVVGATEMVVLLESATRDAGDEHS